MCVRVHVCHVLVCAHVWWVGDYLLTEDMSPTPTLHPSTSPSDPLKHTFQNLKGLCPRILIGPQGNTPKTSQGNEEEGTHPSPQALQVTDAPHLGRGVHFERIQQK